MCLGGTQRGQGLVHRSSPYPDLLRSALIDASVQLADREVICHLAHASNRPSDEDHQRRRRSAEEAERRCDADRRAITIGPGLADRTVGRREDLGQ